MNQCNMAKQKKLIFQTIELEKKQIMSKVQVLWKKQNKELDNDAENNVQLKKQINKETDMDSLIQNSINDKIYDLKQEAVVITKKLQNERYKNLELQTIIKTMKHRMDDERKVEANSVTDSNFQNIESLQRKIKKFEYDLEQINSKANKINSVVSDKKHKISLLRTQRVIDSGIFRNIEKELINTEMDFKKLLIEKVRHEKVYQECLKEYNSLKTKAQQYFQGQQVQQKTQMTSHQIPIQESYILDESKLNNQKNKFKEIERHTQFRNTIMQSDIMRKEEQNSHFEFRVKKVLMNLNLTNGKEFVYNWHNIENVNDKYFSALNKTGDQISSLEEEIKKLEKTIESNSIKFYKPKADLTKNQQELLKCQKIKKEVQKTNKIALKEISALNEFMDTESFAQFAQYVELSDKICPDMDLETLTDLLKSIEEKMSGLSYYQAPKMTEQSIILKTGRTQKQKRQEKLEDVMNRVRVYEQSDKIMRKEDFKEEYRKMMEAGPAVGSRQLLKKKTRKVLL